MLVKICTNQKLRHQHVIAKTSRLPMHLSEFQLSMIFTVNIVARASPMQSPKSIADCPSKPSKTPKSDQDQMKNADVTRKPQLTIERNTFSSKDVAPAPLQPPKAPKLR